MKKYLFPLIVMAFASSGCQQKPAPVSASSGTTPAATHAKEQTPEVAPHVAGVAPASAASLSAPEKKNAMHTDLKKELDSLFVKDLAYADVRQRLLDKGWEPVPNPHCKEDVIGGDWQEVCKAKPEKCQVCEDLKELQSYSSTGHVAVRFKNRKLGKVIDVFGYGDLSDWKVSGGQSGLMLNSWEFVER